MTTDWRGDEEEAFQFVRYPPPEMVGGSPPARERVVRALHARAQEAWAAGARERIAELERIAALHPVCGQCGQPYLDRACGPTHAALAEPMRHPGEAQRQRASGDRARAVVEAARRVDPECGRYAGVDCADHAEPPEVCAPCALRLAVRTHDRGES